MSTASPAQRPSETLHAHRDEILAVLAERGAKNPRIFGSVARGDDTADSDIDILVEIDPRRVADFARLPGELRDILGVPVDVVSTGGLKPKHAQILHDARPL